MHDTTTSDGRQERAQLRTTVLRLGEMLGWRPREVIAFTEALTGRRWKRCGRDEFEAVLDEYRAVGRVIQAKVEKQQKGRDHHAPFE